MARWRERLDGNVPGDLFVDARCIDCDLCRQIAPTVFGRDDRAGQSIVTRQPSTEEEHLRARVALVTCPTASIGDVAKVGLTRAIASLPEPIADGSEVRFCGFASEDSHGAASWLVVRPSGNVLVDSPRAARPLFDRLDALGGVRTMLLTHRDDVADHAAFARRYGCERVIMRADQSHDTRDVERLLDGDAPIRLDDELTVVPVPGHTRGSAALLYRRAGGEGVLFTGDHLWWDDDAGRLDASRGVCWYSWREQLSSLARLRALDFAWVLPGHGRRWHAPSPGAMRAALDRALAALDPSGAGAGATAPRTA